jgi:glycosyltransferase involved in cell wall biosynthesis
VPTSLSIVVPTRNRPADVVTCVTSILATDGFTDLIVVDQSDDRAAETALAAIADPRLRYVRTDTRGVTNGRNLGITLSTSDVVAYTDDDCRVKADWASSLTRVFESDPEAAVVCGSVRVPPEIQHLGFAESFSPRQREWKGRYPSLGEWGITANLALRRSIVARVGAFDPLLGAGAPLRSGGEPDFLYRVLRAGLKVVNAEEVSVDHYGIRKPGPESAKLLKGYGIGTACAFIKHVRLGDAVAALVYTRIILSIARQVCGSLLRTGRPTGAGFLLALLRGVRVSFDYGVDAASRMYVERTPARS